MQLTRAARRWGWLVSVFPEGADDAVLDVLLAGRIEARGQDREPGPPAGSGQANPSRERRDVVEGSGLGPNGNAAEPILQGPLPGSGQSPPQGPAPRRALGDPEQADQSQ